MAVLLLHLCQNVQAESDNQEETLCKSRLEDVLQDKLPVLWSSGFKKMPTP